MQTETKPTDLTGAIKEIADLAALEAISELVKKRKVDLKKKLRKQAAAQLKRDDRVAWTDDTGSKLNGIVKRKNGTNVMVIVMKNGVPDLQTVDPLRVRKV